MMTKKATLPLSSALVLAALALAVPLAGVAPAAKPSRNSALTPYYFYAGARLPAGSGPATGVNAVSARLTQHRPAVTDAGFHSHGSIALINYHFDGTNFDGTRDVIETGWIVRKGDATPRLYVQTYTTVSRPACLPKCGFVTLANARVKPGDALTYDVALPYTPREFAVKHFGGTDEAAPPGGGGSGWYVGYDGQWIGYFKDSNFTEKGESDTVFPAGNHADWFGEVATSTTQPCEDVGSGSHAASPDAARFEALTVNGQPFVAPRYFVKGPSTVPIPNPLNEIDAVNNTASNSTSTAYYSVAPDVATAEGGVFRYGGPGAC